MKILVHCFSVTQHEFKIDLEKFYNSPNWVHGINQAENIAHVIKVEIENGDDMDEVVSNGTFDLSKPATVDEIMEMAYLDENLDRLTLLLTAVDHGENPFTMDFNTCGSKLDWVKDRAEDVHIELTGEYGMTGLLAFDDLPHWIKSNINWEGVLKDREDGGLRFIENQFEDGFLVFQE